MNPNTIHFEVELVALNQKNRANVEPDLISLIKENPAIWM